MSNKKIVQFKNLISEFNRIIANLGLRGAGINESELERDLFIFNKKLDLYGKEFGVNDPVYKDLKSLGENAGMLLEESKRAANYL